ncbi:hypothetical protein [Streptomyces sp. NPDC059743]|uniref:hypothetical protein n=1 Tax=Streptomyces sp. NPDC059743 TaxID=3346928 RepID=UPI00365E9C38
MLSARGIAGLPVLAVLLLVSPAGPSLVPWSPTMPLSGTGGGNGDGDPPHRGNGACRHRAPAGDLRGHRPAASPVVSIVCAMKSRQGLPARQPGHFRRFGGGRDAEASVPALRPPTLVDLDNDELR